MWCNGSAGFGFTRSTSGRGHDDVLRAGSRWPIGETGSRLQRRGFCCRVWGNRKVIGRLIGLSVFTAICCVLTAVAGGGAAFVQRPVGVTYLALWALWWLVIAVGRQRGATSAYDRSQRVVVALGIAVLLGLVVVPPWEYAHLSGPIPRDGPSAWAGLAIFAVGIILQSAAFGTLRGFYTSRLGIQPEHRLVTRGPYRWVRHPGYLSNLLCLTGMALALSSLAGLGLTAFSALLILSRIGHEEEMLLAEFGEEYQAYKQETEWRLVPLIY
jgi:protein-S-isoprenylcysteine O-methyltransferase Ste14